MTTTGTRSADTVERQARRPVTGAPLHEEGPLLLEHELRRFPLAVVSRWAVALAFTTAVAWWAAVGALWLAAETFGLTADVESLARDVGFEGFRLASGPVFLALGLLGVAWIVAVTLLALFAAAMYNLYAAHLGGIRVEAVERAVFHRAPGSSVD
jgi:hypothetical protein